LSRKFAATFNFFLFTQKHFVSTSSRNFYLSCVHILFTFDNKFYVEKIFLLNFKMKFFYHPRLNRSSVLTCSKSFNSMKTEARKCSKNCRGKFSFERKSERVRERAILSSSQRANAATRYWKIGKVLVDNRWERIYVTS
jgi:hypothetical protein